MKMSNLQIHSDAIRITAEDVRDKPWQHHHLTIKMVEKCCTINGELSEELLDAHFRYTLFGISSNK